MNWDWFFSLYSIAAVFMVLGFFWRIVLIPLALVSLVFHERVQHIILVALKLVPIYFMASYAALIGLGVNDGEKSFVVLLLGGVFLFLHVGIGVAQTQSRAEREMDYQAYINARYDYVALLIGVVYYIYAVFDPNPAINKYTAWIYDQMLWVQEIPVVGWIIAAMSFVYVIYMIFVGATGLISATLSLFNSNNRSKSF